MTKESSTYPISRQVSRREAVEEMKRGERVGKIKARRRAGRDLLDRKRERELLDLPYAYPLDRQLGQRRGSIGRQLMSLGKVRRRGLVRVS